MTSQNIRGIHLHSNLCKALRFILNGIYLMIALFRLYVSFVMNGFV